MPFEPPFESTGSAWEEDRAGCAGVRSRIMAKLTIGQKAHRVLTFLFGLRNGRALAHLATCGFRLADLVGLGSDHHGRDVRRSCGGVAGWGR